MKKLFIIAFLIYTGSLKANQETLNHLNSVNVQWAKQKDTLTFVNSGDFSANRSFTDWIATHLMLVEQTLRNRNTAHLSFQQKNSRLALLNELNDYWHKRNFPINDYLSYKSPVFIDRFENYCAVGYLMKQSGFDGLAKEISNNERFAYIADIKTKGVPQWAVDHGFTMDELAWIQPGYPVSSTAFDLSGGLNGSVNAILIEAGGGTIYAGGEFTSSTGGVLCNNIAVYQSGIAGWFWMELGSGLNGAVKTMIIHNNQLIVGGNFTAAGGLAANHIAIYDLNLSQWQAMGSLDSNVNTLTVYNNEIYAGGTFTGYLSKWNGSAWQDVSQGFMYGNGVRTLEVFNNELIIGGDFEIATGALRKHVCKYDGAQITMMGFGTVTPVNDFEIYKGKLYAACDYISGTDTCAMAVFKNFDWEKVINQNPVGMSGYYGQNIKSIVSIGDEMLCAGDFTCYAGLDFGKGMMAFEQDSVAPSNSYVLTPKLYLDSGANCIALLNNFYYFGGDFINNSSQILNHIGLTDILTPSKSVDRNSALLRAFPNPANEQVTIVLPSPLNEKTTIKVTDISGNVVYQTGIENAKNGIHIFETSKFANGLYMIYSQGNNQTQVQKLVVSHSN